MFHKKKFGQHFLTDDSICKRIADLPQKWGSDYQSMLEIGPGAGALTKQLILKLDEHKSLYLSEIDEDLIPELKMKFESPTCKVIPGDFLKTPLDFVSGDFGVIGNFPYNISSQIVFKILEERNRVPEVVGMFQKEVAQRIASPPGSKVYGILSVLVKAYYDVETLIHLKPGAFNPPPKVNSSVIRLTRQRTTLDGVDEALFFKIVKAGFGQRRKTLRNSLSVYNTLIEQIDLPEGILQRRAEELSVHDFIDLTARIQKNVT